VQSQLEPHGCLGDLGWYCIRFALWVMNWKLPLSVTGRILSEFRHPGSEFPVPTAFSGELLFEGEVSSGFYCSFISAIEQWAIVSGTAGYLRIADFVLPFSGNQLVFETGKPEYRIQGCDFDMNPNTQRFTVDEYSHSHPTAQETRLFRKFAAQVDSGSLNELWPEMTLKTQRVMQACRESAVVDGRPVHLTKEH
jgi:predicted dehydrogenase